MKKILYSLAAVATLLFAASCAKDKETALPDYLMGGSPVEVTFGVNAGQGLMTKAIADGLTATKLTVGWYEVTDNGPVYCNKTDKNLSNLTGDVTLTLLKGKTYKIVFWAAPVEGSPYELDWNNNEVVGASTLTANDEKNDAFYAVAEYEVLAQNEAQTITLTRPLAQIAVISPKANIDDNEAQLDDSGIVVAAAPTKMNLLTGETSTNAEITFTNAAPALEALTWKQEDYYYVAVGYVFAPANGAVSDISFNANNQEATTYDVQSASLKRNYRTVIAGNILPAADPNADVEWTVTVDPSFGGENEANMEAQVPEVTFTDPDDPQADPLPAPYDENLDVNESMDLDPDTPTAMFQVNSPSAAPIQVASDNEEVATAEIDGENMVTITAVGNGQALITISQDAYQEAANPAPGLHKAPGDNYAAYSYTFLVVVSDMVPPEVPNDGSAEHPYTVAEALEIIAALESDAKSDEFHVTGVVKSVTEIANPTYKNATYVIKDADADNELTVFRGKGIDGADITDATLIEEGDVVVVKGTLENYNGTTPEVSKDNQLVSIVKDTTPKFGATINSEADVAAAGGTKTITITGNVAWTAAVTGAATLSAASGEGAATITVTIPANESTTETPSFEVTISTEAEVATQEFTFTINQLAASDTPGPQANDGSAEHPYTVAEALEEISKLDAGATAADNVYVTGTIAGNPDINTTYHNATYTISDDGTDTSVLTVYRGKYVNGADFNGGEIKAGDVVVVLGKLQRYVKNDVETPEIAQGSEIVTVNGEVPQVVVTTELTFSANSSVVVGTTKDIHATCNVDGVTINYVSGDQSIVTVNENGVITGVAVGQTTVTASVEAGDGYTAASKTCNVTVTAQQQSGASYVKVTAAANLTEGQYLIVSEDYNVAFPDAVDQGNNVYSVTISDYAIASSDEVDAHAFTLSTTDGGWFIQGPNGNYIGQTSDVNGLKAQDTGIVNTISIDTDGNADIVAGNAHLRYNSNSGDSNNRFRYYKSSSYTNQKAIQLYKYTASN